MTSSDEQQSVAAPEAAGAWRPPGWTPEQAAPGRLDVVRQLVNTEDIEDGIEDLATPAAMRAWLREHGLPDVPRLDAAGMERLIGLRETLRRLLLANNGDTGNGAAQEPALERLRAEAARVPLQVRFDGEGQSALVPAGAGIDAVIGELIGIVHEAMADGTWLRLKACRSETCAWAFYDRSRNRSGTWCSMAVCGNREKARSYRHRHGAGKHDS